MFLKLVEDEEQHEQTLANRYKSFKGAAAFPRKRARR
jgi:hypothetical protein